MKKPGSHLEVLLLCHTERPARPSTAQFPGTGKGTVLRQAGRLAGTAAVVVQAHQAVIGEEIVAAVGNTDCVG